ncbi:MAG: glycosyltransferase family 2 protein [Chloroflexi bacterium]|nr:glycosyltransferase family 2 protein [Chloroflexota bacterium]
MNRGPPSVRNGLWYSSALRADEWATGATGRPVDLSVVILSYNTRALLEQCLDAVVENLDNLQAEVFVVDSGSTDGSIELVRDQYPDVRLTVTQGFGGFAHANNLALRGATGRYQLLLNSDTRLPPGGLARVVAFLDRHPEAGVVGVKLVKEDGSLDLACRRGFPTPEVAFYRMVGLGRLFPHSPRFGRYNLTYLDPDLTSEVDSVCGAFMCVRRDALQEVGLLDERFYFYGEDLDWSLRFHKRGWKVYYYPEVEVLHYKGQTSRQQSDRLIGEFYRAMRVFFRKHYARQSPGLLRHAVYSGIAVSEALARLRNHLRPASAKRVST